MLAHARALLTNTTPEGVTGYVDADFHDPDQILADEAQQGYDDTGAIPYVLRSPAQISRCFEGLEMLEPGLVSISRWRPDPADGDVPAVDGYGAVARKP